MSLHIRERERMRKRDARKRKRWKRERREFQLCFVLISGFHYFQLIYNNTIHIVT